MNVVLGQAGGSIAYRFRALDAHLVLSSGAREPTVCSSTARLRARHTAWISARTGTGAPRGRLYQLVRVHDAVRERPLEITFLEPGAEAFVYTFG